MPVFKAIEFRSIEKPPSQFEALSQNNRRKKVSLPPASGAPSDRKPSPIEERNRIKIEWKKPENVRGKVFEISRDRGYYRRFIDYSRDNKNIFNAAFRNSGLSFRQFKTDACLGFIYLSVLTGQAPLFLTPEKNVASQELLAAQKIGRFLRESKPVESQNTLSGISFHSSYYPGSSSASPAGTTSESRYSAALPEFESALREVLLSYDRQLEIIAKSARRQRENQALTDKKREEKLEEEKAEEKAEKKKEERKMEEKKITAIKTEKQRIEKLLSEISALIHAEEHALAA